MTHLLNEVEITTTQTLDQYLQHLEHGNANQRAAAIALRHSNVPGAHHKQWIINTMLILIAGSAYPTLIEKFESEGNKWDPGIAP